MKQVNIMIKLYLLLLPKQNKPNIEKVSTNQHTHMKTTFPRMNNGRISKLWSTINGEERNKNVGLSTADHQKKIERQL